ncbi:hypothetical protein NLG97_g10210 [Lecanicillium saksenae]|uniref:Uncharacterized protein n=1 Tax=Lecanicillium saksenae TaxID=468837 RepID=A0ACC1QFU2_9HYPO|nr:hypothetical protein NLG97_g10210 [Lecanicillium saksenae]
MTNVQLESGPAESRFAVLVNRGLALFKSLVAGLDHDVTNRSVVVSLAAKFKLWAGSLGAHRSSGSRSLEYRLRDASFVRNHILSLLQDLCESLDQAVSFITGDEAPLAGQEEPDVTLEELAEYFQNEEEETEEMEAMVKSIGHEINCLLRLSITIRNPAPHDHFKSRAGAEIVHHFKHWDLQHIQAKFPDADPHVQQRLAEATSRRRQYLRYREEHTVRLADGLEEEAAPAAADPIERATTRASSLPEHLKGPRGPIEPLESDNMSEASGTSYATSVSSTNRLRVPPVPAEHEDGPIKCPYCHMFILVRNRSDWKRHVFRDLQPYVCLQQDCSAPDHLYTRRAGWMAHIKTEHWKIWHCAFGCPGLFDSAKELQAHLQATHGQDMSDAYLASLESLSGMADAAKPRETCPLCGSFWCGSTDKYTEHVGRHLEELALFALPNVGDDDGGEESEEEGDSRVGSDGVVVVGFALEDEDAIPATAGAEPTGGRHGDDDGSVPREAEENDRATDSKTSLTYDSHFRRTVSLDDPSLGDWVSLGPINEEEVQSLLDVVLEEERRVDEDSRAARGDDIPAEFGMEPMTLRLADGSPASLDTPEDFVMWSDSECRRFPLLLASFGSNWNAIARHLESKTAVVARDYYTRLKNGSHPEWEDIVREADVKRMRGKEMPRLLPLRRRVVGQDGKLVDASDLPIRAPYLKDVSETPDTLLAPMTVVDASRPSDADVTLSDQVRRAGSPRPDTATNVGDVNTK